MAHHGPIALHQDFDLLFAVGVRVWILARHDGPRATRIVPGTELVLGKKQNYFASSDPHHDISKQLVDTTFV
jgi:hypothetical protein